MAGSAERGESNGELAVRGARGAVQGGTLAAGHPRPGVQVQRVNFHAVARSLLCQHHPLWLALGVGADMTGMGGRTHPFRLAQHPTPSANTAGYAQSS